VLLGCPLQTLSKKYVGFSAQQRKNMYVVKVMS
jgi:hypothetical protein